MLLWCLAPLALDKPVTLVLDNARYQKWALVYELAHLLHIELLYLPAYSPNLNLLERLWKFTKKHCLYSTYYTYFDAMKNAITQCLSQTNTKYKDELNSLLTLRFQTFKKDAVMAT